MAQRIIMRRKGETLYSLNIAESEALTAFPENVDLNVIITKARSIRQNNTYWGVLGWVIENGPEWIGERWKTSQAFSDAMQVELGYVRQVARFNGELMAFPESKSFEEMSHENFTAYFKSVKEVLEMMCGYDPVVAYLSRNRET